jgi:hypothetical protein
MGRGTFMIFKFKQKKIVVDVFTNDPVFAKYSSIRPASKFLPDWFKKLPSSFLTNNEGTRLEVEQSTMKRCPGFTDLYSKSFVIPWWSDLALDVLGDKTFKYVYPGAGPEIQSHSPHQYGPENFKKYCHLKVRSPWIMKEKEGVYFQFGNPYWNMIDVMDKVFVATGVANYKHQNASHVNMFIKPGTYNFKQGTPLVMLTPLTERPVEIKTHIVDDIEWATLDREVGTAAKFSGEYRMRKSVIDEEERQSKCPFTGWMK